MAKASLGVRKAFDFLIKQFVSLLLVFPSQAQLMRTLSDVQELKEQEAKFINKPLKKLLKEIGTKIRMASGQTNRPDNHASYIIFKFVDAEVYLKHEKGKSYTSIIVFIKENYDWDSSRKSESENYHWTKEDEKKYGSLTVVGIRVFSEK